MRVLQYISDDTLCVGTEEHVAAYERDQKDATEGPLAWLRLPVALVEYMPLFGSTDDASTAQSEAWIRLINLAPSWARLFRKHHELLDEGVIGKWNQMMLIALDDLEAEFKKAIEEPKAEPTWTGSLAEPNPDLFTSSVTGMEIRG